MIQPADRLTLVSEYYFSRKLKEVAALNAQGMDIISLAIGSPDMPPSPQTIDKLCEVAKQPDAHGYQPTMGTPELRQAMAGFYNRWYGVQLNPQTEVLPLIGSKEGILHVTLAFVNPGDEVLVPNPGYPTYTSLSKLLGAKVVNYNLVEANGWQPDFDELEQMDLSKVNPRSNGHVNSTLARQLALYLTMPSPLQMACDLPENYLRFPDAFKFIEDVPVDWKDSKYLEAEPARYITVARLDKNSDDWYVGAITDHNARTATIDLSFLPAGVKYEATIYEDAPDADWKENPQAYRIRKVKVNSRTRLRQHLAPGGGCAIRITPISK